MGGSTYFCVKHNLVRITCALRTTSKHTVCFLIQILPLSHTLNCFINLRAVVSYWKVGASLLITVVNLNCRNKLKSLSLQLLKVLIAFHQIKYLRESKVLNILGVFVIWMIASPHAYFSSGDVSCIFITWWKRRQALHSRFFNWKNVQSCHYSVVCDQINMNFIYVNSLVSQQMQQAMRVIQMLRLILIILMILKMSRISYDTNNCIELILKINYGTIFCFCCLVI